MFGHSCVFIRAEGSSMSCLRLSQQHTESPKFPNRSDGRTEAGREMTLINGQECVLSSLRSSLRSQDFIAFIHQLSPSDLSSALHSLGPWWTFSFWVLFHLSLSGQGHCQSPADYESIYDSKDTFSITSQERCFLLPFNVWLTDRISNINEVGAIWQSLGGRRWQSPCSRHVKDVIFTKVTPHLTLPPIVSSLSFHLYAVHAVHGTKVPQGQVKCIL